MPTDEHEKEVEDNFEAFKKRLPDLLQSCRDEFALMRDKEIVAFFETESDAYAAGVLKWADGLFSIQEVTDNVTWFTRNPF